MKTSIDIHNHTIASGHAFSTVQEMAHAAAGKGIEYLGITDHGPAIPGTCDPVYFRNYPCVPREMYGVKLLMGCELNILNSKGELDLDEFHYGFMDIRLAGIHRQCWTPGTKEENTEGVLKVMVNPWVNVIAHPGDGTAELDFEPLVKASRETETLLEINSASLKPYRKKTTAKPKNLEILRLCKKYDVPVILSADAHISFDIANYEYALPLLVDAEFPEELVLNDKPEAFFAYTGIIWNQNKKDNQRFIMQKKTIYWGKCYATVEPPTDDYELWFFSDGKVLRENKAFAHMRELKEQGITLIEVKLTKYPSGSRSEENPLSEEEAKNLSRVNYD